MRFNCLGEGFPTVTYEWFYENETGELLKIYHFWLTNWCGVGRFDLMDFFMEREFMTGVVEDTNIGFLSISKAMEEDAGTYICKITTEIGTAESTFTLVVNEPGNCVNLECML